VRWQAPEDYHLTLSFLGYLSRTIQTRLIKAVGDIPAKFTPFTIHISYSGAFDNAKRPSVLWAGLHEKRNTTQLSKAIDRALHERGFVIPPHPYVPHITLGRCRAKRDDQDPPPIQVGVPISLEMQVTSFALMQTLPPNERTINPKSRYTIVQTFPFGNPHSFTH
jgi:2'-5' RNA ligase